MNREFIDSKKFKGIDFSEKGLKIADYEYCTFLNCIFSEADLSELNYSIDPEKNAVEHAKFSLSGVSGLLNKYRIEIE